MRAYRLVDICKCVCWDMIERVRCVCNSDAHKYMLACVSFHANRICVQDAIWAICAMCRHFFNPISFALFWFTIFNIKQTKFVKKTKEFKTQNGWTIALKIGKISPLISIIFQNRSDSNCYSWISVNSINSNQKSEIFEWTWIENYNQNSSNGYKDKEKTVFVTKFEHKINLRKCHQKHCPWKTHGDTRGVRISRFQPFLFFFLSINCEQYGELLYAPPSNTMIT